MKQVWLLCFAVLLRRVMVQEILEDAVEIWDEEEWEWNAFDMELHLQALGEELSIRRTLDNSEPFTSRSSQQRHLPSENYHRKTSSVTPTRQCGEVIGTMTAADVHALGTFFIQAIVSVNFTRFIPYLQNLMLAGVQYDLQIRKECSSCAAISALYGTNDDWNHSDFDQYCSPDSYGYDANLSTVVLVPIDPATGQVFQKKRIRGYLTMHGAHASVLDAFSEIMPSNITNVLANVQTQGDLYSLVVNFTHYWDGIIAASSGTIALFPDFIGFGQSTDWNRTFLTKDSYKQAAAVAWLDAKHQYNGQCNKIELDNAVTVSGWSEGGYAAIPAAVALQQLGVEILAVYPYNAPFDLETELMFIVSSYNESLISPERDNYYFYALVPFIGFAFSQDHASLDLQGQKVISDEWLDPTNSSQNAMDWYKAGAAFTAAELVAMAPRNLTEMINPVLLSQTMSAIATGTKPCDEQWVVTGETDHICRALRSNGLFPLLNNVSFPTFLCFSEQDTVVPITQRPPQPYNNPFLKDYEAPLSALGPQGDHGVAGVLCGIGPLTFFTSSNGTENAPNLMKDIPGDDSCATANPTPANPTPALAPASGTPGNSSSNSISFTMQSCSGAVLSVITLLACVLL